MASVDNAIRGSSRQNAPVKNPSNCYHCGVGFNLLKRKHACGHCGLLFCKSCTEIQVQIPKYGHRKPTNVCCACFCSICIELDDRKSLEGRSIEELKRFAARKGVEIQGPMEKYELIERFIEQFSSKSVHIESSTSYSFKNEELPEVKDPTAYPTIDNKNQINRIEDLSISSLKLILHNNGIDHQDCLEKSDLIHKVKKFCPQVLGITTKSELFNIPENEQCIICFDHRIDCVLLECGHLAVCMICSKNLRECPICRRMVSRVVQTFHVNR
eukprot:TRINITY_DN1639_c0_g1_i2.p1 TRINITY_DN1639_c0_g1~~TRINITY_DN1639_c0_g1_i2.p1  ORF type:complete len:271 (+),score=47.71 TRINITY_DN1639_c0_g1_i2:141-953(+)